MYHKAVKLSGRIAFFRVFIGCLLLTLFNTAMATGPMPPSLAPMLQKILPSIVNIRAQIKITDLGMLDRIQKSQRAQNNNGPVPDKAVSVGSGVIVDANKGYILTNAHVIENAETVMVTLGDGHHYTAKIIGMDRPSDIALIQVHAKNLSAIHIGNSNSLQVGDPVAAIGNPFGLNQSVTSGIVSALGRNSLGIEGFENFIQIDASINPGNSGGALVDSTGSLVGINTAILAPDRGSIGIGFAIPSNLAVSVMRQLIEYGNFKRGMLGIGAQDLTPDLVSAFSLPSSPSKGAVVTLVIPDSPAASAGLQVGDIITAINDTSVDSANDVVNAVAFLRVDSHASVSVLRNGKKMVLKATLNDPKKRDMDEQKADPFFHGVSLKHFTLTSPIHGNIDGVLVVSVEEDTNAWHSDLRPGDVITLVRQKPVSSAEDIQKAAAGVKDNLLVHVLRGNSAVFLVINREY